MSGIATRDLNLQPYSSDEERIVAFLQDEVGYPDDEVVEDPVNDILAFMQLMKSTFDVAAMTLKAISELTEMGVMTAPTLATIAIRQIDDLLAEDDD